MKKPVRLKMLLLVFAAVLIAVVDTVPAKRNSESNPDTSNLTSIPADIAVFEAKSSNDIEDVRRSITCDEYDEHACKANATKCGIGKMTCYADNHLQALTCMAMFSVQTNVAVENRTNTTEEVPFNTLKKLLCISVQRESYMECLHEDRCEQRRPTTPVSDAMSGIGACCCHKDNCNNLEGLLRWNWEIEAPPSEPKTIALEMIDTFGTYWWIVMVLLLMMLMASIWVLFVACRKMRKKGKDRRIVRSCVIEPPKCGPEDQAVNTPLVKPEPVEIEMVETPKELPITDFLLISKGRFGQVFRATWTDTNGESKLVAVKKLAVTEKKNFLDEKKIFDLLVSLPKWYPSIVNFVAAEKIGDEFWIVTEFHERLSLYDLLVKNVISITSANRLILSMIDGLQFLHDDRPFFFGHPKEPIIHRDIKSKNILVKMNMTACIADFGLARTYHFDVKKGDLLGQVGTRRYMSPEVLEGATEFTPSAFKSMDVYSMALVMWEVIYRTQLNENDKVPDYEMPYSQLGFNPSIGYMRNHVVVKKDRPQFRDKSKEHDYMSQLIGVVEEMWDPAAYARITAGCAFAKVWDIVKSSQESSEGYHSSGESGREIQEPQGQKKGVNEMIEYHNAQGRLPHPTTSPFKDQCPPVPPIPSCTEAGENQKPDPNMPDRLADDTESENYDKMIFDVEMNRLLTAEELEEQQEGDTRASTPTPSGTF